MTAPEGNSSFCFPRISVICYIAGNFEAENSLNLAVTGVVRQHSWVTVHWLPSDVTQRCPLRDFVGK